MSAIDDIQTKLSDMAKTLLDSATEQDRLDVFKTVSTWHLGMKKATKGEDDDDGGSFNVIRNKIRSAA